VLSGLAGGGHKRRRPRMDGAVVFLEGGTLPVALNPTSDVAWFFTSDMLQDFGHSLNRPRAPGCPARCTILRQTVDISEGRRQQTEWVVA